jgi:hypothetical protein
MSSFFEPLSGIIVASNCRFSTFCLSPSAGEKKVKKKRKTTRLKRGNNSRLAAQLIKNDVKKAIEEEKGEIFVWKTR